ncbi:MAG: hypothetical protein GEV07_09360 [Streptosporangiales bacterium]|nr:hypothetical protein [Streptosporangiales bacterium]
MTLSERAYERLPVPAPVVRTAPPKDKRMLVRMPTWFWLGEAQHGSRSATARAGDNWATVTASARTVVVDPGDDPVTCAAPGVSYAKDADEDAACTHAYEESGTYTVRVTVRWGASWVGSDGDGGSLPAVGRSASFRVTVVESRSELVAGS